MLRDYVGNKWEFIGGGSNDVTDYSSISLNGWSSTTTKYIYCSIIGKLAFLTFYVSGESNSANMIFYLPISASRNSYSIVYTRDNNGLPVLSACQVIAGSNYLYVYNGYSGDFTTSGFKLVKGSITIFLP